jgi:hypothetical protein
MPLYLEILDQHDSVAAATLRRVPEDGVSESWTSTTTGEIVRLVDAPDVNSAPNPTVRVARILFH